MVQSISDLVKIAGQTVERSTLAGLKTASAKSGVSFQYLVAKAAQESSLDPEAQAHTSSAAGLFQFTRGTWLDMMHRYGSQYGYGDLARQITVTDAGKAVVKDVASERRLMDLREDPEASGLMAAAYAQDNAAMLESALGRIPDAADLYLAHFLGASGAGTLLTAARDTPQEPAAGLLPAAAKANRSIFYTPDGVARSAAEVVALVRERFTHQLDRFADAAPPVAGSVSEARAGVPAPAPARAPLVPFGKIQQKIDPTKQLIRWMVLEEMAKLIAMRPMHMTEDGEDGETGDGTGLASAGFQGQDFAAALMRNAGAGETAPARHQRGAGTYRAHSPAPSVLDDLL